MDPWERSDCTKKGRTGIQSRVLVIMGSIKQKGRKREQTEID